MKPMLPAASTRATLAALGLSLIALAGCDRKPSPTPPKPTTQATAGLSAATAVAPPALRRH